MKRNPASRIALCAVAVLAVAAMMLSFASCSGTAAPVDYSKIASVPEFSPNLIDDKLLELQQGKLILADDGTPKVDNENVSTAVEDAYYYCSKFIVLPSARTTITVTVSGDLASVANNESYYVMVSGSLNSDSSGLVFNKDGAKYAGNAGSVNTVDEEKVYTFTYVSGNANEAIRLCFPTTVTNTDEAHIANDVKVSICYTPNEAPTFTQTQQTQWWVWAIEIGVIVLLILAFYFFVLRPQKKQEKKNNQMRDNLAVGDEITTISGIIGEVVSIKDETVTIETGRDKVQIRILRTAIRSVDVSKAAPADDEKSES